MKPATALFVTAGLLLSACASGPGVSQRYAQPGDIVKGGSAFATQAVKRFVIVNGTTSLKDQTIKFSLSDDGKTVYVTQNHKDYTLVYDGVSKYVDGTASLFRSVSGAGVVETAYLADAGPGYFNDGFFVIGYRTDPTQVTEQSGTATFTGLTQLNVRTATLGGFADGTVVLNANFDAGTVTGTMSIVDDPHVNSDFVVPDALITINPGNSANIAGNLFATDLAVAFTPAPGDTISVSQSGLTGGFYGVDAAAVGATYWATGLRNGQQMFIQGALASN